MSIYICERCGRYRDGDYHSHLTTRIPGEREERDTCEDCVGDLCDRVNQELIAFLEIDGEKYEPNT